jgi:inosose dehydratase
MAKIQIGCQTYTWQMSGERYLDKLQHIVNVASTAGFAGLEPEVQFLREFYDPVKMAELLDEHQIKLAAVCLVEDWLSGKETEPERVNADQLIDFLKHFPDTMLALCQMPGSDRSNLKERQANLLACVNDIARRAFDQGVSSSYHPNSPAGSIYRTAEDYDILLNGLDASVTGWAPDVGHIANGAMDPLQKIKEYRSLVRHVHFKDMYGDRTWAQMGKGTIDFAAITSFLRDTAFDGWLIVEDECKKAVTAPDVVTREDGAFMEDKIAVLIH